MSERDAKFHLKKIVQHSETQYVNMYYLESVTNKQLVDTFGDVADFGEYLVKRDIEVTRTTQYWHVSYITRSDGAKMIHIQDLSKQFCVSRVDEINFEAGTNEINLKLQPCDDADEHQLWMVEPPKEEPKPFTF
jgi:hypothetical protein